jgi:hypothetical protein
MMQNVVATVRFPIRTVLICLAVCSCKTRLAANEEKGTTNKKIPSTTGVNCSEMRYMFNPYTGPTRLTIRFILPMKTKKYA